nr:kelch-like protein 17 [Pocillopora verrucosa]
MVVQLKLHFNVYFAEKYDFDEFMNNRWRFVLENFPFVAALDEFLNLEAKEVEKWLSRDDISVETEADVFKIVLEWIKHSKSERKALFEQLFRYVRLVLMSRDYLIDVVTNELVRESFAFLMLTCSGLKMSSFSSERGVLQTPRKGVELHGIVACGVILFSRKGPVETTTRWEVDRPHPNDKTPD